MTSSVADVFVLVTPQANYRSDSLQIESHPTRSLGVEV